MSFVPATSTSTMKACGACGSKIVPGDQYCIECGVSVISTSQQIPKSTQNVITKIEQAQTWSDKKIGITDGTYRLGAEPFNSSKAMENISDELANMRFNNAIVQFEKEMTRLPLSLDVAKSILDIGESSTINPYPAFSIFRPVRGLIATFIFLYLFFLVT